MRRARGGTHRAHTRGVHGTQDRPGTEHMRDERPMVLFVWMSPNQLSEKRGRRGPLACTGALGGGVTGVSFAFVISLARVSQVVT